MATAATPTPDADDMTVAACTPPPNPDRFFIHLRDGHLYSLLHRPPPASPLLLHSLSQSGPPAPPALPAALARCAAAVARAAAPVAAAHDSQLDALVARHALQRARALNAALSVLRAAACAARAVLGTQASTTMSLLRPDAGALCDLTRADDIAQRLVSLCRLAASRLATGGKGEAPWYGSKRRFSLPKEQPHLLSFERALQDETEHRMLKLSRAKEGAHGRLERYATAYARDRAEYDSALRTYRACAAQLDAVAIGERQGRREALVVRAVLALRSLCECAAPSGSATLRKRAAAVDMELRQLHRLRSKALNEKAILASALRSHATQMGEHAAHIAGEGGRIRQYNRRHAALAAIKGTEHDDSNGNGENEVREVLAALAARADKLRGQAAHLGLLVLHAASSAESEDGGGDDDAIIYSPNERMMHVSEFLLDFYAGWAAVKDYCDECVFHVNNGRYPTDGESDGVDCGAHTNRSKGVPSSSRDNDPLQRCAKHIDSLAGQIRDPAYFSADID